MRKAVWVELCRDDRKRQRMKQDWPSQHYFRSSVKPRPPRYQKVSIYDKSKSQVNGSGCGYRQKSDVCGGRMKGALKGTGERSTDGTRPAKGDCVRPILQDKLVCAVPI